MVKKLLLLSKASHIWKSNAFNALCIVFYMYTYHREYFVGLHNSSSSTKFDSGTGWPSFHSAIEVTSSDATTLQLSVAEKHDYSHGMIRVEVLCQEVRYFFPK